MEQTIFLAQFMGAFSIIAGLSMVLRKKMLMAIFSGLAKDRPLLYAIGMTEVLAGLLIVINHNIWSGGATPILISILGWFLLIEGTVYLFISQKTAERLFRLLHKNKIYFAIAIGYLVIGAYLVYSGF